MRESPQTRRRGKGKSVESGQLPHLHRPKAKERRKRARPRQTDVQKHSHPSHSTEAEREGRKPHQTQHQVHPETPPASPAHLKGGKKKQKKSQGAKLPKKFPRGGRSAEQGRRARRPRFTFFVRSFLTKKSPLLSRPNSTKVTCHVSGANPTPTPSTSGVGITINPSQEGTTLPGSHPRTNP